MTWMLWHYPMYLFIQHLNCITLHLLVILCSTFQISFQHLISQLPAHWAFLLCCPGSCINPLQASSKFMFLLIFIFNSSTNFRIFNFFYKNKNRYTWKPYKYCYIAYKMIHMQRFTVYQTKLIHSWHLSSALFTPFHKVVDLASGGLWVSTIKMSIYSIHMYMVLIAQLVNFTVNDGAHVCFQAKEIRRNNYTHLYCYSSCKSLCLKL